VDALARAVASWLYPWDPDRVTPPITVAVGIVQDFGPVHLGCNPSYSACFFNRSNIFFSQKISQ
jgi:hypothetical protein